MTQPVLFEELPAAAGKVGVVTLNLEKTLNSLTLEMVELMLEQLPQWQSDPDIGCVLIRGAGEKAFCAGGDVQALHTSAVEHPGGPCLYAEEFFEQEYRLDYLIHRYGKPVICWGHGIVMGGGLGIFAGCSHRVVTERTRMAMPEVTIALYPDVGGSWFLNRMPGHCGLFLALTGAHFNGSDARFLGLADYRAESADYDNILQRLCALDYSGGSANNAEQVGMLLRVFDSKAEAVMPKGNVAPHMDVIDDLCRHDDIHTVALHISELETEDAWLCKARDTLMAGSPLSVLIIARQLALSLDMSLEEVFQSELQLSTNVVRYPEFAEGVRALLIDKDKDPQWRFEQIVDVPEELLESFFEPPWDENPLEDLGES